MRAIQIYKRILITQAAGLYGLRNRQPILFTTNKTIMNQKNGTSNPFRNLSYTQILKLIESGVSQKNENTFNRLIMEDAINRAELIHFQKGLESYSDSTAKEILLNRVLERMLDRMKELEVQDIYLMVRFYFISQDKRYCKINIKNKDRYKTSIHFCIKHLVEKDKQGAKKETFKKLLYALFASKKLVHSVRDVIKYLALHDFKKNEDYLQLFKQVSPLNKTGFYDSIIQPFIIQYMDPNTNNLNNTNQWVKPIILDMVMILSEGYDLSINPLFSHILSGIQQMFQKGEISPTDELEFFTLLLDYFQFKQPYSWKTDDINRCVQLINLLRIDIKKHLLNNYELSFEQMKKLFLCFGYFKKFAQFGCGFLNKSYNNMFSQFLEIKLIVFTKQIIQNKKISIQILIQIISYNESQTLPLDIQYKFVICLINRLIELEIDTNRLITRMRAYQYIVKSIKMNQFDIDLHSFIQNLKKLQTNCHSMREYQIIRLYNIFRILGIQSPLLTQIFFFNMEKKESVVVQNLARTSLKSLSIPLIEQGLDSLKTKLKDKITVSNSIVTVVWSSSKNTWQDIKELNRDPIFNYWIHRNYQFFGALTSSYENCYIIYSNAIKELYLNSKGVRNSSNTELLIQVLKSWNDQNPKANQRDFHSIIIDNLKGFTDSKNIIQLFSTVYRHSFFIKIMWTFYMLAEFIKNEASIIKIIRQFKQLMQILNLEIPAVHRDRFQFKIIILFAEIKRVLKYMNWNNRKYQVSRSQLERCINYFGLNSYVSSSEKELIQPAVSAKDQNEKKQKKAQTFIPDEIINGTLTADTPISQSIIFDLLANFDVLFQYFNKYDNLADQFILKVIEMNLIHHYVKLIQANNLVNKCKHLLSLPVLFKFKQWVCRSLQNYNPSHSPNYAKVWVSFNHTTPQFSSQMRKYITHQLQQGNIYQTPIFYLNNYNTYQTQSLQFLETVSSNNIFPYLAHMQNPKFMLINSILGFCLNQNNFNVLQKFMAMCLKDINIGVMMRLWKENILLFYQIYMLLSIAKIRVRDCKKYFYGVGDVLGELEKYVPTIRYDCLERVRENQKFCFQKIKAQFQIDPTVGLRRVNGKILVIDMDQPGFTRNVREFLENVYQISDVTVQTELQFYKNFG